MCQRMEHLYTSLTPPLHSTFTSMPTTNTTAVSVGCGCRKLKLSKLLHRKPPHKHHHHRHHNSSAFTSWNTTPSTTKSTTTTTTVSSESESRTIEGFGRIGAGGDSVAVEKDSDDPYADFRDSMLQMIMEKEIYGRDDLRELLNCFLQLNSPYYHGIIIGAFNEIWNNHVLSLKLMHGGDMGGA